MTGKRKGLTKEAKGSVIKEERLFARFSPSDSEAIPSDSEAPSDSAATAQQALAKAGRARRTRATGGGVGGGRRGAAAGADAGAKTSGGASAAADAAEKATTGGNPGGKALSEKQAEAFLNQKLEVLEKEAAFLNFSVQEIIDLIK